MSNNRVVSSRKRPHTAPVTSTSPLIFVRTLVSILFISLVSRSTGVALDGGPGEVVGPTLQQPSVFKSTSALATQAVGGSGLRVKRSRDVQQLCGYRLLDALRTICNGNFVRLVRKDPNILMQGGKRNYEVTFFAQVKHFKIKMCLHQILKGDGQSNEDSGLSLGPWEALAFEYPQSSSSLILGGGDMIPNLAGGNSLAANNHLNWESSYLDYLELFPSAGGSAQGSFGGSWSPGRTMGGGNGASSSNKAFALKMLTEPPATHQRFRRNIVEECCKKPCALDQMVKYCAGASKRSF